MHFDPLNTRKTANTQEIACDFLPATLQRACNVATLHAASVLQHCNATQPPPLGGVAVLQLQLGSLRTPEYLTRNFSRVAPPAVKHWPIRNFLHVPRERRDGPSRTRETHSHNDSRGNDTP